SSCSSRRTRGSPSTPTRSSGGAASRARSCRRSRTGEGQGSRRQDRILFAIAQWAVRPISADLEAQPERGHAARDLVVERLLVGFGLVGLQRARVRLADLPERVARLLDELEIDGVTLLRLIGPCAVVCALALSARLEQVGVVLPEDRDLPADQVFEASHPRAVE